MRCLVAGGGGFIGGHLVERLLNDRHTVKAVDIKSPGDWWQMHDGAWNVADCDLSHRDEAFAACDGMDWVFNLAADMGGISFIENHKAACMLSVLINTHLLAASKWWNVSRYFYSSSACVYHASKQSNPNALALKETDVYGIQGGVAPEAGYGEEKWFSEQMCKRFRKDYGLETRVARFHNIYGPNGEFEGGREKAPAALCRKVAEAKRDGKKEVEIWGDGTLTRSFCHVDDCVEGIMLLMKSDYPHPLNIGSSELVTVTQLLNTIEFFADYYVSPRHDLTKPQGVAGRNSDNTLCKKVLSWEPTLSLAEGIAMTYPWIEKQVTKCS